MLLLLPRSPLYHEEGEKEMLPPTHCLNTLLQVNTGAKPKDYSFKKLQEIGMKIPYVVRALAGLDPTLPEITAFLPTGRQSLSVVPAMDPSLNRLFPHRRRF
jgi:hypothetical protein